MAENKKEIWGLKQKIKQETAQREQWAAQLPDIELLIADGSGGDEAVEMKNEILANVDQYDKKLQQLQEQIAELEATLPEKAKPAAPKFDPEKHPLLKTTVEESEPAKPVTFNAGDVCEAQWTDRQWYKVKVQTVLGSVSDPKYHVRFLDYQDSTLTVGRDSIRRLASEKKRKAETTTPAPPASSPHIISGPASINPAAVAANKEAATSDAPPNKRRQLGNQKDLGRSQMNWKNFMSKTTGKKIVKESQFRTNNSVNSRVGVTGSGKGMTAGPTRVRHNAKADQEIEEKLYMGQSNGSKDEWHSRDRY